jgi:uncharacterized protein
MTDETDLSNLLRSMKPQLNEGEYVFCIVKDLNQIDFNEVIGSFKEKEGLTVIIPKSVADELNLSYSHVASWITLTVHSSLEAVGLTAAFAKALEDEGISCNVVAAFYHDHIFVSTADKDRAITVLEELSNRNN